MTTKQHIDSLILLILTDGTIRSKHIELKGTPVGEPVLLHGRAPITASGHPYPNELLYSELEKLGRTSIPRGANAVLFLDLANVMNDQHTAYETYRPIRFYKVKPIPDWQDVETVGERATKCSWR